MGIRDKNSAARAKDGSVVHLRPPLQPAAADLAGERGKNSALAALYLHFFIRYRGSIRRVGIGVAALAAAVLVGFLALWWRLASGPIQVDVLTPWLAAAIEENFGTHRRVEVGGTQIERTENGGIGLRIRDIVVRDADGTIVASAPKAEVHVSTLSLLSGHMRAESLNLVGAEMAVRIEREGSVTIFAGANKRPIATAVPAATLLSRQRRLEGIARSAAAGATPAAGTLAAVRSAEIPPAAPHRARDILAALLSWINGIGKTGLDGHDLRELGLKNGNLTVDDERTGKRWNFRDISLSVQRLHRGGVELAVGSSNRERPWALAASITPSGNGLQKIAVEARRVLASDLLLAARFQFDNSGLTADLPLSASISGEIGPDGEPQTLSGRIVADAGSIGDPADKDGRLTIDRAELKFTWDASSRMLTVPFRILSGGNRMTMLGQVEAPEGPGGAWQFKIGGGTIVLTSGATSDPLILNRISISGIYDVAMRRFVVDEGDLGNTEVGVAASGSMDFSGGDMRLRGGFAGTRMSADALKRLWPVFVATKVRDWFDRHVIDGTVERIVIAVNAPFETLKNNGPPIPEDGLSIDLFGSDCVVRPVEGLPALRDADLTVHIVGRDAVVSVGKAFADLPSGRKLTFSSGTFEVPDTAPHEPPARVRFRLEGSVPAAVELLQMDRLRDVSDLPLDPTTSRGTITAHVTLGMPLKPDLSSASIDYAIAAEAANFSADHLIMGQKVEAATLRANANPRGFVLKGDVKIGGTPASLEYRKMRDQPDAEVRIKGMLDETARNNLGLDTDSISGAIPFRLSGHVASGSGREGRFAVEADLTPVQIDGLLPGWVKPAGKPARATFTATTESQSIRIDNLLIEGAGGGVRGTISFNGSGELQSANFPIYGFSDGDRTSLKIERTPDKALRVIMRGDVYDGRGFVKSATGAASKGPAEHPRDVDLDIQLGAVVGFNGEALRGVDLKMTRRAGEIRSFGLTAKIGRKASLTGSLHGRPGSRQTIVFNSNDAGAFFRFADIYARMTGGQMSILMDPPTAGNPVQQGILSVRGFAIHDEAQLERAVAAGPQAPQTQGSNAIAFSTMRVEFSRMPGRVSLRDGVVRGPLLGGTIDGVVDYARDEVHLRGTLVPLYGPNNLLGLLPLVGLFLGGENEGLVGITYEVVGQPGAPVLRINPISALAPGILRKVFEFPASGDAGTDGAR